MPDPSGGFFIARPAFCDVACWHQTDVPTEHGDVCYPGMNGLGLDAAGGPVIAPKRVWPELPALPAICFGKPALLDGQGIWVRLSTRATMGSARRRLDPSSSPSASMFVLVRRHTETHKNQCLSGLGVFYCAPVFVTVSALFVVFPVSLADGLIGRTQMAGKLKPLDVAREVTPGKYLHGDGLYLVVAGPTSQLVLSVLDSAAKSAGTAWAR